MLPSSPLPVATGGSVDDHTAPASALNTTTSTTLSEEVAASAATADRRKSHGGDRGAGRNPRLEAALARQKPEAAAAPEPNELGTQGSASTPTASSPAKPVLSSDPGGSPRSVLASTKTSKSSNHVAVDASMRVSWQPFITEVSHFLGTSPKPSDVQTIDQYMEKLKTDAKSQENALKDKNNEQLDKELRKLFSQLKQRKSVISMSPSSVGQVDGTRTSFQGSVAPPNADAQTRSSGTAPGASTANPGGPLSKGDVGQTAVVPQHQSTPQSAARNRAADGSAGGSGPGSPTRGPAGSGSRGSLGGGAGSKPPNVELEAVETAFRHLNTRVDELLGKGWAGMSDDDLEKAVQIRPEFDGLGKRKDAAKSQADKLCRGSEIRLSCSGLLQSLEGMESDFGLRRKIESDLQNVIGQAQRRLTMAAAVSSGPRPTPVSSVPHPALDSETTDHGGCQEANSAGERGAPLRRQSPSRESTTETGPSREPTTGTGLSCSSTTGGEDPLPTGDKPADVRDEEAAALSGRSTPPQLGISLLDSERTDDRKQQRSGSAAEHQGRTDKRASGESAVGGGTTGSGRGDDGAAMGSSSSAQTGVVEQALDSGGGGSDLTQLD